MLVITRFADLPDEASERLRDYLVTVARRVLVDHRRAHSGVPETSHQLLEAGASRGGQRPARVAEIMKMQEPRSRQSDAIIVAPASYNTINKWAGGISDTYALGILAETTGLGVPTVVLPFVNSALAGRAPFRRNVESLRAEGVRILLGGPGGVQPHQPHIGVPDPPLSDEAPNRRHR